MKEIKHSPKSAEAEAPDSQVSQETGLTSWSEFDAALLECAARETLGPLLALPAVQEVIEHAAEDYEFHSVTSGEGRPDFFLMGLADAVLDAANCTPEAYQTALNKPQAETPLANLIDLLGIATNEQRHYGAFKDLIEDNLHEFMEFYVFAGTDKLPTPQSDPRPSELSDPEAPLTEEGARWITRHYAEVLEDTDTSKPALGHKRIFPSCYLAPETSSAPAEEATLSDDALARYHLISSPENTAFSYQREALYAMGEHLNQSGRLLPLPENLPQLPYFSSQALEELNHLEAGSYQVTCPPFCDQAKVKEALVNSAYFSPQSDNEATTFTNGQVNLQFTTDTAQADVYLGHPVVRALVVQPTGTGKTVIFTEFLEQLHGIQAIKEQDSNSKTLITVHSTMLQQQTIEALADFAPSLSVAKYGDKDWQKADVTVVIYKSAQLHLGKDLQLGDYSLAVFDEVHKGLGKSTSAALANALADNPSVPAISFTATEQYSDEADRQVQSLFPQEIKRLGLIESQSRGFLVTSSNEEVEITSNGQAVTLNDEGAIKDKESKTALRSLLKEEAMLKVADLINRPDIKRKPTLVFVRKKEDARALASFLKGFDRPVASLTGDDKDQISDTLKDFKRGDLDVLVVTPWAFHGIDLPNASVGICVDSSQSLLDRKQMLGRLLRRDPLDPLKEALFIEFTYPELDSPPALYPQIMQMEQELAALTNQVTRNDLYSRGVHSRQQEATEELSEVSPTTKKTSALADGSVLLLLGTNSEQTLNPELVNNILTQWTPLNELALELGTDPSQLLAIAVDNPNSGSYAKQTFNKRESEEETTARERRYLLSPVLREFLIEAVQSTPEPGVSTEVAEERLWEAAQSENDTDLSKSFAKRRPRSVANWRNVILRETRKTELEILKQEDKKNQALPLEIQRIKGLTTELAVGLLCLSKPAIPQPFYLTPETGAVYPDYLIPGTTPEIIEVKFGLAPVNIANSVQDGLDVLKNLRTDGTPHNYRLVHLLGNYKSYQQKGIKVERLQSAKSYSSAAAPKVIEFLSTADFSAPEQVAILTDLYHTLTQLQAESLGFDSSKDDPYSFALGLKRASFERSYEWMTSNTEEVEQRLKSVLTRETTKVSASMLPLSLLGYDTTLDKMVPKRFVESQTDLFKELDIPAIKKFLSSTTLGDEPPIEECRPAMKELDTLLHNQLTLLSDSPDSDPVTLDEFDRRLLALTTVLAERCCPELFNVRPIHRYVNAPSQEKGLQAFEFSLTVLASQNIEKGLFPQTNGIDTFMNCLSDEERDSLKMIAAALALVEHFSKHSALRETRSPCIEKALKPISKAYASGKLEGMLPPYELKYVAAQVELLRDLGGLLSLAKDGFLKTGNQHAKQTFATMLSAHNELATGFPELDHGNFDEATRKILVNQIREVHKEFGVDLRASRHLKSSESEPVDYGIKLLAVHSASILARLSIAGWSASKGRKKAKGFSSS